MQQSGAKGGGAARMVRQRGPTAAAPQARRAGGRPPDRWPSSRAQPRRRLTRWGGMVKHNTCCGNTGDAHGSAGFEAMPPPQATLRHPSFPPK